MPLDILMEANSIKEWITKHQRYLHAHAEIGFDLPETFAYVMSTLKQLNFQPQKVGKCGIVASVGKGEPVVMLRADMDALPMKEETDLAFSAQNGHVHACGHDFHTAMLLGAAAILKKHESKVQGTILFMFQPAEEILSGASDMIADGLLDNHHPNYAFMVHVMNAAEIQPGTVIIPPAGVSAPAADMFMVQISGMASHGAMPHHGIDPINAGAHLVLALQSIGTRETGLAENNALTIASFQAGDAVNVVPDKAVMKGSVRSYDLKTQQFIKKRIEDIAAMTAKTFRAQASVQWLSGCPTLVNAPELVKQFGNRLPDVIGNNRVLFSDQLSESNARSVGSEDFSYISQHVPSLMVALAAGGINNLPLHHPGIIFNEDALPYGAAVYAAFGLMHTGQ